MCSVESTHDSSWELIKTLHPCLVISCHPISKPVMTCVTSAALICAIQTHAHRTSPLSKHTHTPHTKDRQTHTAPPLTSHIQHSIYLHAAESIQTWSVASINWLMNVNVCVSLPLCMCVCVVSPDRGTGAWNRWSAHCLKDGGDLGLWQCRTAHGHAGCLSVYHHMRTIN